MDNLAAHKRAKVGEAIERAGCTLMYLPPYSPDLNPIELASPSSSRCCEVQASGQLTACGSL